MLTKLGLVMRASVISFWFLNIYTGLVRAFSFKLVGYVPEWLSFIQEILIIIAIVLFLLSGKKLNVVLLSTIVLVMTMLLSSSWLKGLDSTQAILLLRQYWLIPIASFVTVKIFPLRSIFSFFLLFLVPSAIFSIFLMIIGREEAVKFLIGAYYSGNIENVGKFATLGYTGFWKNIGTFSQPFTAGFYYSFGILASVEYFKKTLSKTITILLFLFALFSTFSRTSMVILTVFTVLTFMKAKSTSWKLLGTIFVVLIILLILLSGVLDNYLSTVTRTTSLRTRFQIWHIRFGGYLSQASFGELLLGISRDLFEERVAIGVDNTYNGLIVDIGLLGFSIVLFAWIVALKKMFEINHATILALFAGVLVGAFAISFAQDKVVFSLVWLITFLPWAETRGHYPHFDLEEYK